MRMKRQLASRGNERSLRATRRLRRPLASHRIVVGSALGAASLFGLAAATGWASGIVPSLATPLKAAETEAGSRFSPAIVGVRRLTEGQYRNAIADIFGPDIVVSGRFEPMVRPRNQLLATAAMNTSISPTGMEQFDALARGIAAQVFDEKHRANFVACAPHGTAQPDTACARQTLAKLGHLLFRRPLSAMEQATFVRIADESAQKTASFYTGLEFSLAAMLISPEFLYIMERTEPDPDHPGQLRLDGYSRASRLSFILWNTTPSPELLAAAGKGDLTDQGRLQSIAATMVKSPRFRQGVRAFFSDMLVFEKFDDLNKDPVIYRRYNADVAKALPEQMLKTIVDTLVSRDADYRELFTTRRTFVNRSLGPLYNIPVSASDGWMPFDFDPESDRAGITSLPGFLSLYSHSGRSSPTLRGRAIRELLLCQPVPDPPGNVNFTAVQDTSNKAMPTARIRLSAHIDDPVCAGCHKITDPIGLSLERFDGIGAYRQMENGAEIDQSGMIGKVAFDGPTGLGRILAADESAPECVVSRALEYATGRSADDGAQDASGLARQFAASGYRIPALFLAIATMPEAYRVNSTTLTATKTASR
jgi:hypothetical protein